MKWLRLWVDEIIKGTTFDELSLSERGLWFSLLLLAGNSLTPGIVEMRKGVGYSQEILARVVNCDRKTLMRYLKKLVLVGKISPQKSLNPGKISPQKGQQLEKIDDFAGIFPQRNGIRLQIVNWHKYQTRYEKYYKNKNDENEKDAKNNGIPMPGRLEEEVDKKKRKKEKKTYFRPNVQLTEKENQTLIEKYGEQVVTWIFDKLSLAKETHGYKYKSDYGAINSWVIKAWEKERGEEKQQQGTPQRCKVCKETGIFINEDGLCTLCSIKTGE